MRRNTHTGISSSQSGFTLVELMVVVAIIGVLAAVAGPRIQSFRARGIQSEAKANLNSIYLAQSAFQDANDKFAGNGACTEGTACGGLTFTVPRSSKYKYGITGEDGRWAAGAASKQSILNNKKDKWRINTNKVLCANFDAVKNAQETGCTQNVSDTGTVTTADADNPN